MTAADLVAALKARIGETVHESDWLVIDQSRIDAFADATGDRQWIHVDPERAARESPFGACIAHGFLTLSLYPLLRNLVDARQPAYPGVRTAINYGLNKVRYPSPVPAGARVRARFELLGAEEVAGGAQILERYSVEIENQQKPACVAEVIARLYP